MKKLHKPKDIGVHGESTVYEIDKRNAPVFICSAIDEH